MQNVIRGLEIARWVLVIIGFQVAYYFGTDAAGRLHLLMPFLVFGLAGLTGMESVFFAKAAAKVTGYVPSAYQRQSGLNNLAVAIVAIPVLMFNWGTAAEFAILLVVVVFLFLSALNHAWSAIREGNRGLKNIARPFMTLILIVALLPILLKVWVLLQK